MAKYSATKRAAIISLYFFTALMLLSACSTVQEEKSDLAGIKIASNTEEQNRKTRVHWRKKLVWNNNCEDAFSASYFGPESGIDVYILNNGLKLVSVLCSAGAYQPSFLYFIVDEDAGKDQITPLKFMYYESKDGQSLQSNLQSEIWGEARIDSARGLLSILNLARQSGDCGSWAVYAVHRLNTELLELWTRFPCPSKIETHAELRKGKPPKGWVKIDPDKMQ